MRFWEPEAAPEMEEWIRKGYMQLAMGPHIVVMDGQTADWVIQQMPLDSDDVPNESEFRISIVVDVVTENRMLLEVSATEMLDGKVVEQMGPTTARLSSGHHLMLGDFPEGFFGLNFAMIDESMIGNVIAAPKILPGEKLVLISAKVINADEMKAAEAALGR